MVDIENRQFVKALLDQQRERLGGDFIASLREDFARIGVEEILREILAVKVLARHADCFDAFFGKLTRSANSEFFASFKNDLAGVGVNHI